MISHGTTHPVILVLREGERFRATAASKISSDLVEAVPPLLRHVTRHSNPSAHTEHRPLERAEGQLRWETGRNAPPVETDVPGSNMSWNSKNVSRRLGQSTIGKRHRGRLHDQRKRPFDPSSSTKPVREQSPAKIYSIGNLKRTTIICSHQRRLQSNMTGHIRRPVGSKAVRRKPPHPFHHRLSDSLEFLATRSSTVTTTSAQQDPRQTGVSPRAHAAIVGRRSPW